MSILLLLTPVWRWLGGAALILLLVLGIYAYGHHKGAVSNEAEWQAAMAAEKTRQAAVRAKALDEAVARELARAAENEALEAQVNQYEADLAKSLSKAPAGSCDYRLRGPDVERLRLFQRQGPNSD